MNKELKIPFLTVQIGQYETDLPLWKEYVYTEKETIRKVLFDFDSAWNFFKEYSCIDVKRDTTFFRGLRRITIHPLYEKKFKFVEGKSFKPITYTISYAQADENAVSIKELQQKLSAQEFTEYQKERM